MSKQLIADYGDENTRIVNRYETGSSVQVNITLNNEFNEPYNPCKEETYVLFYVTCTDGECKGYDGMLQITKL